MKHLLSYSNFGHFSTLHTFLMYVHIRACMYASIFVYVHDFKGNMCACTYVCNYAYVSSKYFYVCAMHICNV